MIEVYILSRLLFPRLKEGHDLEVYLDWKWKYERFFEDNDMSDIEQSTYVIKHL